LLFQFNSSQSFGLIALKIKEMIIYTSLNQLPESHSALAGITELRGNTLPIIYLSLAMGLPPVDLTSDQVPSIVITNVMVKHKGS